MEFWQSVIFCPVDECIEIARAAESMGYAGVAAADHVAYPIDQGSEHPQAAFENERPYPDPMVLLSAMATATTSLRFTTYALVLPMRDPFTVAKSFATLSLLSGNRVALGVAAGWMAEEFALLGREYATRGARLDEDLAIIRALWEPGLTEFHGDRYDFRGVVFEPKPREKPPILVGGHSDAALRRAAAADGWLGLQYEPAELAELVGRLQRFREELGRDHLDHEIIVLHDRPREPMSHDLVHRLEDLGIDGLLQVPLPMTVGERSSLSEKLAAMEEFADEYIRR